MEDVFDKTKTITIWDELQAFDIPSLTFLPWGSATIEVPEFVRQNLVKAAQLMSIDDLQYSTTFGSVGIRQSLAKNFGPVAHWANADPDSNVMIYVGAIELTKVIIDYFVQDPQDEVILFEPYYPWHMIPFKYKGVPVFSQLKFDEATRLFSFDLKDLEAKISERTRVIVLCNPNNPTGRIFSDEEYQALSDFLNKYPGIRVVEDAAYSIYVNPGLKLKYFHELDNNSEKTIAVFSAGKIFNTTGIRIGFAFGSSSLIPGIKKFYYNLNWPPCVEQKIIELSMSSALEPYKNYDNFWEFTRNDNFVRGKFLIEGLNQLGVECLPFEGTYYILINIENLADCVEEEHYHRLDEPNVRETYRDRAVARKLAKEFKIGLLPVSSLYKSAKKEDRFLRIAVNRDYDRLQTVLNAFSKLIKKPNSI